MSYHPNDADLRLAEQEAERREHEHSEWFSTLPLEEQIAWLQQAGKDAAEALSRNREKLRKRRQETR